MIQWIKYTEKLDFITTDKEMVEEWNKALSSLNGVVAEQVYK